MSRCFRVVQRIVSRKALNGSAGHLRDGLVVCPVTYSEIGSGFSRRSGFQEAFLRQIGVNWLESWIWQDTVAAHQLLADHVMNKRAGHVGKRPVADVFIEAFALLFQGLITRDPKHFTAVQTLVS